MGTLKGFVFCALIITVKMMIAESALYTSPDTTLKFSQCLIEKMSESSFFTLDDRNSMIAVRDVMSQALHSREHSLISSKILMTAFITSLADIIIDNDPLSTSYRKETYSSALQQCSISSTGYADAEFITEAQRILSVIESNKPVKYEEPGGFSGIGIPVAGTFSSASFSQTSNIGNPVVVQPSPVQNPPAPQYFYPNDRTVFEQQENPNNPPITSLAQGDFNLKRPIQPSSQFHIVSSFGTGMPAQPENLRQTFNFPSTSQTGDISSSFASSSQYKNFPVGFDEGGLSQSQKENFGPQPGKFPNDYDIVRQSETGGSDMPQYERDFSSPQSGSFPFRYDTGRISETDTDRLDVLSFTKFSQTSPINTGVISKTSNEGLSIPQEKESSVIVIPPETNPLFIPDEHLSENKQKGAEEVVYMPENQEAAAQSEISDISMASPTAQKQQPNSDVTSSQRSEDIVFNILANSTKFRENFNSGISQENAINLARNLMERTFSSYDSNIMNDALSVCTEEVLKVIVPSPETFAFAMSNAIVIVVKRHESSLSADPSQIARNFVSNLDYPVNSQQETIENQPKDYNKDDTLPVAIPEEQQQNSEVTSYPTLESSICNILTSSPKFKETFNSEISQENAINLARDITERTFASYDSNIKNDALSAVTKEVLKVRDPSPETFAFAISNALAYMLKNMDSSLWTDHSQLSASFLSNLGNPGQFYSQQDTVQKQPEDYNTQQTLGKFYPQPEIVEKQPQDYDIIESASYELSEQQTDFDFQSPPLSPEDRKDEMFSLSLSQYLTKSESTRNFFCGENKPEDKVPRSFSIIKASLIDYGQDVATLAASVTSGALSELSEEGLCSNYAKTISEIVAGILEENGIDNANAEDVARKMELNLLQQQITPTESPKPASIPENVPLNIPKNETYATEPKLESSFAPIEEIKPQYSEEDKYPSLATSYDSEGCEFTYPVTLLRTAIALSTARPNISSERENPDGFIDQQTFGDDLYQHFHTLESIFSEESDENNNKASSTTETIENQESGEFTISSIDEFSQTGNQKEKTPESDTIAISSDQFEADEYRNPITVEVKNQDESEISQKNIRYSTSPDVNDQTSPVELQPSFQSPVFKSDDTTVNFQKNSGDTSYESDHIDTSVVFARQVSEKAESIIALIRSRNFNLGDVCSQLNQFAPLVDIPELDYCEPIAAMDYLLNVLRAVVKKLSGV